MGDAPYRPEPATTENEALLARLAAEGQKRLHDAAEADARTAFGAESEAGVERERTIRMHLAAYDGTPLRKAWCFALVLGGVVLLATTMPHADAANKHNPWALVAGAGCFLFAGGALALFAWRPLAKPARVSAERAWVKSLPFSFEGYFDMLGADPMTGCRLLLDVEWQPGKAPAYDTLQGVFGRWDARATVGIREGGASVQSGPFKCGSDVSTNDRYTRVRPNRELVDRAHRAVVQALAPLHASYPIARVTLKASEERIDDDVVLISFRRRR